MPEQTYSQQPYFLFTRSPLHVGAGQSVGYVDLPIQREPHTRIPIIPGTSLKGVLRGHPQLKENQAALFGRPAEKEEPGHAGGLLIGEARVLAFPVRSARGCFAWITCPLMLSRYTRDVKPPETPPLPDPSSLRETSDGQVSVFAAEQVSENRKVVLEEYTFSVEASGEKVRSAWESHLLGLLPDEPVWKLLQGRLVILPDGIFSFFVQSACEVAQHVSIDDNTGTAKEGALFNQENCPPETLFYGMIAAQEIANYDPADSLRRLAALSGSSIQVGGNETTGLGWCTFTFAYGKEGN